MTGIKAFFRYSIAVLLLIPQCCFAQNFNTVFDHDSTDDWGYDVFEKQDGTYLVFCTATKNGRSSSYCMNVSKDGQSSISQSPLTTPGGWFDIGAPGRMKKMPDGTYLVPLSIRWYKYTASGQTTSPGIALLDNNGQVIFSKVFVTDTSCCDKYNFDCAKNSGGEYYIAGFWNNRITNTENGMLMKLNNMGDLIWEKQYNHYTLPAVFNTIQLAGNDRIVLGGTVEYVYLINGPPPYHFFRPWFSLLDTAGNVIRDTLYEKGFIGGYAYGGGCIYKDINGGYYHYGSTDKIYDSAHIDRVENFPDYLAHLDDNFRITWIHVFADTPNRKYIWTVKQLHDGSYLVLDGKSPPLRYGAGWAAKVDKNGKVIWDNTYIKDTTIWDNYLADATELSDHSIVLTGSVVDGSQPQWHRQDVWMLRIDSNGCEMPGCVPTSIKPAANNNEINVYPNPALSELNIEGMQPGTRIQMMDMYGRVVYSEITNGDKTVINTSQLPVGSYVLLLTKKSGERAVRKVVKE